MSELEKFKQLLDDLGIKYDQEESTETLLDENFNCSRRPVIGLEIDQLHFDSGTYQPSLHILFKQDGSFLYFSPGGE